MTKPADINELDVYKESEFELQFWRQCVGALDEADLPHWQEKHHGHKVDWTFYAHRLLVEIQGGVNDGKRRGQHVRRKGYIADRRFAIWAQANGWTIYEFTDAQLDDGSAIRAVYMHIERTKDAENDTTDPGPR